MENTHFLTAIEEESLAHEESAGKSESKTVAENDAADEGQKSDLIDFGTEPDAVKVRKPSCVDQFFAKQADACLLSPIKAKSAPEATSDPTQESLDLKLEGSDCPPTRVQYQTECVQPNDSTFTMKDDTLEPLTEGAKVSRDDPHEGNASHDGHSRKRLQDEMEPAVFDVPRGSKMVHREKATVPEFRENIKPSLQFLSGNHELFKPKIVEGEQGEVKPGEKSSDVKSGAETEIPHERQNEDDDGETETPCATSFGNITNRGFNMTLDMTLRTSGGVAFASGLFLAIDEALDPLVGALVPYGRRRRGTNIIAVCFPILLAVYFLLFR